MENVTDVSPPTNAGQIPGGVLELWFGDDYKFLIYYEKKAILVNKLALRTFLAPYIIHNFVAVPHRSAWKTVGSYPTDDAHLADRFRKDKELLSKSDIPGSMCVERAGNGLYILRFPGKIRVYYLARPPDPYLPPGENVDFFP